MKIFQCLFAFTVSALAQMDVAPPPKPLYNGASLEATLNFIQDKVTDEGKVSYTAFVTDTSQSGAEWSNRFAVEVTQFVTDVTACQLSFHWQSEVNGKMSDDKDYTLNLKQVRDIVVLPQEQNQKQVDAQRACRLEFPNRARAVYPCGAPP